MELVELGIVLRPHGYKGGIVAMSDAGQSSALAYLKTLFIGDSALTCTVHSVIESAWMPKGWKLELSGIDSENAARILKGLKIFASREDLAPVQDNEYYIHDLLGSAVFKAGSEEKCGTLTSIEPVQTNERIAQDRWWIESNGQIFSIPATTRYIERIDIENKSVWMKNLSDFE